MELVTPGIGLIFWQLVTFLAVVFILSRVAWKPILKAIKEREDSIEEALESAKRARDEMKALSHKNEDLLKEARLEREKLIKEAQKTAAAIVGDAQEKARAEYNKITEEARTSIEGQKTAAMATLRNYVADLSMDIAERVIGEKLADQGAQKELVNKYLKEANDKAN